jgi:hypothetical protein
LIVILKPLENIKINGEHTKAVGIPEWRLKYQPSMVVVDIQYKYRAGPYKERQFPNKFQISKSEIMRCKKEYSKEMRGYYFIVPIDKMAEMKPPEQKQEEKPPVDRQEVLF